jgi:hypothetical protein
MQRRNGAARAPPHRAAGGGSVRHAEKRRPGSCPLANRIARASLGAYDRAVPASYRDSHRSGTCVAAIVAHFRRANEEDDDDGGAAGMEAEEDGGGGGGGGTAADDRPSRRRRGGRLQVMGLGVGTKFLPRAILREEEGEGEGEGEDGGPLSSSLSSLSSGGWGGGGRGGRGRRYGGRVRDCHAEVLARRAFRRQISLEMAEDAACGGGCGCGGGGGGESGYVPILERAVDRRRRGGDDGDGDGGGNGSGGEQHFFDHNRRYRLRDGVTLHFYASSAPCEW